MSETNETKPVIGDEAIFRENLKLYYANTGVNSEKVSNGSWIINKLRSQVAELKSSRASMREENEALKDVLREVVAIADTPSDYDFTTTKRACDKARQALSNNTKGK